MNLLPASYADSLPGVHFSPSLWTDNDPNITLLYNNATHVTAYIEDFYQQNSAIETSAAYNIVLKFNATTYPDSLFWSFASSGYLENLPPDTPEMMAVGNGTLTPVGGVNQQLMQWFGGMKRKRLGIVMLDYFGTPGDLVGTFLSLASER